MRDWIWLVIAGLFAFSFFGLKPITWQLNDAVAFEKMEPSPFWVGLRYFQRFTFAGMVFAVIMYFFWRHGVPLLVLLITAGVVIATYRVLERSRGILKSIDDSHFE